VDLLTNQMTESEFCLNNPPNDGISSLSFSPFHNSLLLVTSWNSEATIYNTSKNSISSKSIQDRALLDGIWINSNTVSFAGLDGQLKVLDILKNETSIIGSHENAIRSIVYNSTQNTLYSGSWDSTVKVWDLKSQKCISTLGLPGKVYSMAMTPNDSTLVVGTSGRNVYIYDKSNKLTQKRESSLKYQTRCIKCFNDNSGYALGSIEGRCAMEYFDPSEKTQSLKYAFKCHRTKDGPTETLYPVNALSFHPIYGTFATGGSDKCVNIWDGFAKKRLWSKQFDNSISALSFSGDGNQLAIASSYCFEKGEQEGHLDQIYIRTVSDSMVKPK
jgi:cell cycle arrest protein BUB3